MYMFIGIIGMVILGAFNSWNGLWMLGGFIGGVVLYGIYYMMKNSSGSSSGMNGSDLGGCLIFAILAGILEGL